MLKSRIESKSGSNKDWKPPLEHFDGTIRSFGIDDRPSTELCRGEREKRKSDSMLLPVAPSICTAFWVMIPFLKEE